MNDIRLKGILKNIQSSHTIQGIEFDKATLIVPRDNGKEDAINIRFKKYSNPYQEDQEISIYGNVRSYSTKVDDGKNKVELYVFTYFDLPDLDDNDQEYGNNFEVDGRICKIEAPRKTKDGKTNIHLILANNLIVSDGTKRLNSYIPCIAWGSIAKQLSNCSVNDKIKVRGELHSREYKKTLEDGSFEFRVAHECVISEVELV